MIGRSRSESLARRAGGLRRPQHTVGRVPCIQSQGACFWVQAHSERLPPSSKAIRISYPREERLTQPRSPRLHLADPYEFSALASIRRHPLAKAGRESAQLPTALPDLPRRPGANHFRQAPPGFALSKSPALGKGFFSAAPYYRFSPGKAGGSSWPASNRQAPKPRGRPSRRTTCPRVRRSAAHPHCLPSSLRRSWAEETGQKGQGRRGRSSIAIIIIVTHQSGLLNSVPPSLPALDLSYSTPPL